jgi:porin
MCNAKNYNLYLAGSLSLLGLLILDTSVAVAETSELAAVSALTAQQEPYSTTSTLIVQTVPEAIPQQPIPSLENPVTSVSQLADVQPTDWAYQALQSLIERYSVVAGYPNRTYQGNLAMTRYEFAASLNAALERVNELIAAGLADQVSREDLVTLQRLQQEFAVEVSTTLRVRIDSIEARAAELEANQFSTTTKLTGQAIFAVNGGSFSGESIVDPTGVEIADDDPNTTVLYRTALDFNTSFLGTDLLKIRLDTGSNGSLDNAAGVLEPNFGSVLDFSVKPPRDGELGIGRLYYTFIPFQDLSVTLGPAIVPTEYLDRNSYANLSALNFTTQALVNNYILFPINGQSSGGVIDWNPNNGSLTLRAMYVAADAANPNNQGLVRGVSPFMRLLYPEGGDSPSGIFGDPYQGAIELEYAPSRAFALRLQYSGGSAFNHQFDVVGANFELALSRRLGIFGRYGYGSYDDTAFGDINPNYWMAGVAFRDLFLPGALAGIAAGQPFIESAVGNATQTNMEAFYNFPLNDRLRIAPLVQVITNPANQGANGTIVTGTLRTVFSF